MTRPKFFLVIPRRHPVLASLLPPRNTLERAATAEAAGEEETAKGAEAISGAAVERDQGGALLVQCAVECGDRSRRWRDQAEEEEEESGWMVRKRKKRT